MKKRLLAGCVQLFATALLLYWTVQLVCAVWWWLVGGLVLLALLRVLLSWLRYRRERW